MADRVSEGKAKKGKSPREGWGQKVQKPSMNDSMEKGAKDSTVQ